MSPARESREIQILLPEGWARPSGYSHGVSCKGPVRLCGWTGWVESHNQPL